MSLLYKVSRRLLSAVLLRRDRAKNAEHFVLRHENAVLWLLSGGEGQN